jgi:hypothetical protein
MEKVPKYSSQLTQMWSRRWGGGLSVIRLDYDGCLPCFVSYRQGCWDSYHLDGFSSLYSPTSFPHVFWSSRCTNIWSWVDPLSFWNDHLYPGKVCFFPFLSFSLSYIFIYLVSFNYTFKVCVSRDRLFPSYKWSMCQNYLGWFFFFPKFMCWNPTPHMNVSGDRDFTEVMKVKCNHE